MDIYKQGFLVSECSHVLRSSADIVCDGTRHLVDCAVGSGSCSPTYRKLKRNRGTAAFAARIGGAVEQAYALILFLLQRDMRDSTMTGGETDKLPLL